jgi:hypothetical protein
MSLKYVSYEDVTWILVMSYREQFIWKKGVEFIYTFLLNLLPPSFLPSALCLLPSAFIHCQT